MQGGETFVPKIPSIRVVDLANSLAPGMPHKIIGIRPGEKLHEVMCPKDDSHLTIEFDDHFVIRPSIVINEPRCYSPNLLGEKGREVNEGFEYNSESNGHFLTVEELRQYSNKL